MEHVSLVPERFGHTWPTKGRVGGREGRGEMKRGSFADLYERNRQFQRDGREDV